MFFAKFDDLRHSEKLVVYLNINLANLKPIFVIDTTLVKCWFSEFND